MSFITWKTPAGKLGTIRESDYNEFTISAEDSDANPIEYALLSGSAPTGMRVTLDGKVRGVPVIINSENSTESYVFTVRAASRSGAIADRTFSISVNNQSVLKIVGATNLGTFDDGSLINFQFNAISENPNAKLTWKVIGGQLPNDIRTNEPLELTSSGLLTGYIARLLDTTGGTEGYDVEPEDAFPYDFEQQSLDKIYSFKIEVTDGSAYAVADCIIYVVSKGRFTADNDITVVNNTNVTVDADSRYIPIITTEVENLPTLQAGSKFNFKFDAIDPEGDELGWTANAGLPAGLGINPITGWLSGSIPSQTETFKSYTFTVQAFKVNDPTYLSNPLTVTIDAVKDAADTVTWVTGSNVGAITNGSVSELKITAVSNLDKDLVYTKLTQPSSRLPQGLKLLTNGEIVGRTTFQYFSLDGDRSNVFLANTTGISTDMTVSGPGVSVGTDILNIYDGQTIEVSPAIYAVQGTSLTFSNLTTTVTRQVTSLSTSTQIDGGDTTFDTEYRFTAKVETVDGTASDTREFFIKVDNFNRAPYENIYLKALPLIDQRQTFSSIINNREIFPPELIYRKDDPWFGTAKDIRALFLPGLSAEELSTYGTAVINNHYNKKINFGKIKTARAVDDNFNTKYEVVYVELEDNNAGANLSVEPRLTNPYMFNGNTYTTIYPNSFGNMQRRLAETVGYNNRGALPDWMTSPQEDGRVLGLTRAVVLAYTIPGASKLIAYRLQNNGITFNDVEFVVDRYHLDNTLSKNFDPTINQFNLSRETTFDILVETNAADIFVANVVNDSGSTVLVLDATANVGFGWDLTPSRVDSRSIIENGTRVTFVNGSTVTLNKPVSLYAGDEVRFVGTCSVDYAVSVPFDTIHGQTTANVAQIDSVSNYNSGDTLVFVVQEDYPGNLSPNDGWNRGNVVVPGYAEKLLDPTEVNQRAGIWQIDLSGPTINLVFLREILPGQFVRVNGGFTYPGTFVTYGPGIESGSTVPAYSPGNAIHYDSAERTYFDGSGTRFYDFRDSYTEPGDAETYIKFPQTGIYPS